MLYFLRKHQYGFMLVVAIVVIIAFTFFYSADSGRSAPEDQEAFNINGESKSFRDLETMKGLLGLTSALGFNEMYDSLTSERVGEGSGGVLQAFAYNLTLFRQKTKGLGIEVSDEEIMKELKSNRNFLSTGGKYDGARFDNFKSNTLPRLKITPEQMFDIIRDKIRIDRFSTLLTAAATPSPVAVDTQYQRENQKVVAYVIAETLEEAKKGIEVSEESIKEHYDKNVTDPNSLKTQEKRSVEYVFFKDPTVRKPATPAASTTVPAGSPLPLTPPAAKPTLIPTPAVAPAPTTTPDPAATLEPTSTEPAPAPAPAPAPETAPEPEPVAEPEEENGGGCQGEEEVVDEPVEEVIEAVTEAVADVTEEVPAPAVTTPDAAAPTPTPAPTPAVSVKPTPGGQALSVNPSVPAPIPTLEAEKPLTPEEKRELTKTFGNTVQSFLEDVRAPGADFATIAKEYAKGLNGLDIEYHKIEEMFTQDAPPTQFDGTFTLTRKIFEQPASKPLISPPPRENDGFWVIRIISVEAPRDLTLDEAREQIKEALSGTDAVDAISKKFEETREKLAAESKDGPSFKAAAEAMGFKVERLSYDRFPPMTEGIDIRQTFQAVNSTVPGQISEPQIGEPGALIAYVAQKVVDQGEEAAERTKRNIANTLLNGNFSPRGGSTQGLKSQLFRSWMQKVRKESTLNPTVITALQRSAQ